jgi:hypothetical protein
MRNPQCGVKKTNAGAAVAGQNHSMIIEFEVAGVDAERARLNSFIKTWVLEPTNQPWGYTTALGFPSFGPGDKINVRSGVITSLPMKSAVPMIEVAQKLSQGHVRRSAA